MLFNTGKKINYMPWYLRLTAVLNVSAHVHLYIVPPVCGALCWEVEMKHLTGGFVCVKTSLFHKYKLIDEITKNTGKVIMWK